MDDFIKYLMTLAGVLSLFGGIIVKYINHEEKQNKENTQMHHESLKGQSKTNELLSRLNINMEHQFELIKKDSNNNFSIIDDNFGILNGELVEIKKIVFKKDQVTPNVLRRTNEINN